VVGTSGLGEFEQLVLLAVLQENGAAYAAGVRETIGRRTGRDVARGAIHVTLDRLEQKGFLRSSMTGPTPARGGKARRVFSLTAPGRTILRESLSGIDAMLRGLSDDLGWSGVP